MDETSGHINVPMDDPDGADRRANLALRVLIDEMLERVRDLNRNTGLWTADERARAEAELDTIMARVRRAASRQRD